MINATGVFTDGVRRMDTPGAAAMIAPSQGVHLVLDREFSYFDENVKTERPRPLELLPERVVLFSLQLTF